MNTEIVFFPAPALPPAPLVHADAQGRAALFMPISATTRQGFTPDPFDASVHPAGPQTWGRYSYAANEPINH